MAEPTDLTLERLRREDENTNATPTDLLRLCADDIRRDGLTGKKMLVILYDDTTQSIASSWRCGLTRLEEVGLIQMAGLRSIFGAG